MTDETTTEPNVMAGDVITQLGLYESRGGDIMPIIGWGDGWWVSELNGTRDWYGSDGRQRFGGGLDCSNPWQLLHWVGPLPASEVEPDKTQELPVKTQELPVKTQELPVKTQELPVKYTPPDGWSVLQVGEELREGDMWVWPSDDKLRQTVHAGSTVGANQRYIRRIQVCEGRWRTRGGEVRNVTPTPEGDGRKEWFPWWDARFRQTWTSDGRYHGSEESRWDLVQYLGAIEPQPEPQPEPQEEPEPQPEPQPQPQPQPQPVQVCEGRWKTRGGEVRHVTPTPASDGREERWPWWDAQYRQVWRANGRYYFDGEGPLDLVEYLAPIVPEAQVESQPETDDEMRIRLLEEASIRRVETIGHMQWELQQVRAELAGAIQSRDLFAEANRRQADMIAELQNRIADLETINAAQEAAVQDKNAKLRERADEFRSEVSYVQNLLGTEKLRMAELEELVTSLRTINAAQEQPEPQPPMLQDAETIRDLKALYAAASKALVDAGNENTALERQLAVVKEELTTAAAVCVRLQIELDAAQQVPADSPQLRQLRSDLAEVTRDRDEYRHAHGLLVQDANTAHERTRAMTVEAIVAWLDPFRGCNSPSLALLLLESLPNIMRSLTGLDTEDVE